MDGEAEGRRPRGTGPRKGGKAAVRPPAETVKCTITLSVEMSRRLTVHAAYGGLDRSGLVEALIREHCRRFVVQDRGGGGERQGAVGAGGDAA